MGVAYKGKKMSTDLITTISVFLIIPAESGVISGTQSTTITSVLLVIIFLSLAAEK